MVDHKCYNDAWIDHKKESQSCIMRWSNQINYSTVKNNQIQIS